MSTRPPASLRVATVLSPRDLLALDAAAIREDISRSTLMRKVLRQHLRSVNATPAVPVEASA